MASELLKNRALTQKIKEPDVPDVKFDLSSTDFEEFITLPEPKPQELLDIQEDVRVQRQQDTMDKARPFLMDESIDFIERENFAPGSKPKYAGSLTDIYTILIDQWNSDLLKAYEAKDLSKLENSFSDYAGKELNISSRKVNSQISSLYKRNKLDERFLDVIQFRKELAKELITEANQGLKYTNLKDIASKLGPNYKNATLKTLMRRVPEIPELDSYETKINKAFEKIFLDVDPKKVLAKNFFDPAQKIRDVIGTGIKGAEGRKKDAIYKALKNNPNYKDLGFDKIFNRLRSKDFQKVVLKSDEPWNLSDVSYAVDNDLNLKNPKSIDQRAVNFAIRSKIQGNPNIEIFSREGDRLVKLTNPKNAQIDNYYDIVFQMDGKRYGLMGDIPGVINLQKEGRQLPEFKNFYAKAAAKDELAQRTKFPDGTDIINPRTGKLSTFEDLMKDTYYFARGKMKGYAMAFPYDLEHLDIKNDPFGNIDPKNLRILPKRVNVSVGDKTGKIEDVIKKTGYFFEKDLPLDQQLNNLMNRERDLAQKVLVFDEEGNHIGRRLDTAAKAAKKQIELRGVKQLGEKKLTAFKELASRAGSGVDPILLGKAGFEEFVKPAAKIGARGAATLADLAISAGKGGTGLALGALLEADPIITGMTEGKTFGQTARDTFVGSAIDAIPGVNLGSLNEDLMKLADTEEQRVGIQNLIDYQKDYDRFVKDLNAFKSYRGLDQIALDELGFTASDLVNMESSLAERFKDIQTRAPKVYNPDVFSLVRELATKEAEKRKANLEGIQGLIFGDRMIKDPNFIENQIQQILAASTGVQGATDSYTDNYRFLPQEQLSPEELDERFDMEGGIMAANGGRIGFAEGPKDPKRRLFLKLMGGIASLPIFSKFIGKSEVAKPIAKVAGSSTKMPEWFPDLIDKVMFSGVGKRIDADLTIYEPKELPGVSIGRYDDGRVFVEGENAYGKKYQIEYEPPGYELIDEQTGKAVKTKGEFIAQEEVPVNIDPDGNADFDVEVLDNLDEILGPDTRAMEEFATGKKVKDMKQGEFAVGKAEADVDRAIEEAAEMAEDID
jgi:hypothetical protein